jgi:hypothetical protein
MDQDHAAHSGQSLHDATLDPTSYARGLRDAAAMLDADRQMIRLHAGEMTAAEMRTVLAVLAWKRNEMMERAAVVAAMGQTHAAGARTGHGGSPSREP